MSKKFTKEVIKYIKEQNGETLCYFFAFPFNSSVLLQNPFTEPVIEELKTKHQTEAIATLVSKGVGFDQLDDIDHWTEMIVSYIQILKTLMSNIPNLQFFKMDERSCQSLIYPYLSLVQAFLKILSSLSSAFLPLLISFCKNLKRLSILLKDTLCSQDWMKELSIVLNKAFMICLNDRSPIELSKKWAAYHVVNTLFYIYAKLNQFHLSKNAIKAIQAAELPSIKRFSKAVRATWNYYSGRVSFVEGHYHQAEKKLHFALMHSPVSATSQKRFILHYLIPLNMLKGILPSRVLLEKYGLLTEYHDLIISVRTGDLALFNHTLEQHQYYWSKLGILLVLEKCKWIIYRNAFKKVYILNGKDHKLPLELFSVPLKMFNLEYDVDNAECLLANLIDKGLVKGYLAHEKGYIVLSQKDPFPTIYDYLSI